MVTGSVTRTTGTMGERESMEAFVDGAKKASSAARELSREFTDPEWEETAIMLDAIRVSGIKLSEMKSMNRLETLMAMNMKKGPIL